LKSLLHYLHETNGEAHLWLNDYVSSVGPPNVDAERSAQAWLVDLAAMPLQTVTNPGRSSAPSLQALEAATSTREVSPRDLVERLLALRLDIAAESIDLLGGRPGITNAEVLRAALAKTTGSGPTP
jgi:hypothetical protein